uniref:Uncharacterized protein n=1 Tax=Anguilla anguilla TaxID=7936 RepID=A0A0E9WX57_ANGAN
MSMLVFPKPLSAFGCAFLARKTCVFDAFNPLGPYWASQRKGLWSWSVMQKYQHVHDQ